MQFSSWELHPSGSYGRRIPISAFSCTVLPSGSSFTPLSHIPFKYSSSLSVYKWFFIYISLHKSDSQPFYKSCTHTVYVPKLLRVFCFTHSTTPFTPSDIIIFCKSFITIYLCSHTILLKYHMHLSSALIILFILSCFCHVKLSYSGWHYAISWSTYVCVPTIFWWSYLRTAYWRERISVFGHVKKTGRETD